MLEQSCQRKQEKCEEESVRADLAHAEFALGRDNQDGDAEVAEGAAVEKGGGGGSAGGVGFTEFAELDQGVGEGYYGEHLKEKDGEVDHVVGVEFVVARGVEGDVGAGERGGREGVPVAVDDAGPLVGAHEVADIHVGYGVAVDLVAVVDGI